MQAMRERRIAAGLCIQCGKPNNGTHQRCDACWEKYRYRRPMTEGRAKYAREYQQRLRERALLHYGFICNCCGLDDPRFLSIDHINGDGNLHRREIGGALYHWLRKNNYPEGFQTLCYNCNLAKGSGDHCPHQDD